MPSCIIVLSGSALLLSFGKMESINRSNWKSSVRFGLNWLVQEQNASSGQWGAAEYPALTGLALQYDGNHRGNLQGF